MRVRLAAPSTLAGFLWAAGLFAQGASPPALTTTGQLLSTGNTSLVVKTDDGRESGPFVVTTTTQLPPGLAAADRVTVYYHPVGDRPVADRVVRASAPARPSPAEARPAPDRPTGAHGPSPEEGIRSR